MTHKSNLWGRGGAGAGGDCRTELATFTAEIFCSILFNNLQAVGGTRYSYKLRGQMAGREGNFFLHQCILTPNHSYITCFFLLLLVALRPDSG
jgi:hypothetical protein